MKLTDHKKRTLRVILVGSIFAILYMAISARAVHLHIFKGPWLSQKAECEYKKSFTCLGKRGTIFDTNHKEMAVSVNATSIAANPTRIKNPRAALLQPGPGHRLSRPLWPFRSPHRRGARTQS